VEGGSLIYGQEGLVAATGMAETMFNLVYPDDTVSVEEGVRRLSRRQGRKLTPAQAAAATAAAAAAANQALVAQQAVKALPAVTTSGCSKRSKGGAC